MLKWDQGFGINGYFSRTSFTVVYFITYAVHVIASHSPLADHCAQLQIIYFLIYLLIKVNSSNSFLFTDIGRHQWWFVCATSGKWLSLQKNDNHVSKSASALQKCVCNMSNGRLQTLWIMLFQGNTARNSIFRWLLAQEYCRYSIVIIVIIIIIIIIIGRFTVRLLKFEHRCITTVRQINTNESLDVTEH